MISDLHLPSSSNKTHDMFGEHWKDHPKKIKDNWIEKITSDDIILLPGDLSWAMTWDEALVDLDYLTSLPGTKIIVEGNHDFWLSPKRSKSKRDLKSLDNTMSKIRYIHNDSLVLTIDGKKVGFAGTKGWSRTINRDNHDDNLIKRQLERLQLSLNSLPKELDELIIMMHFPPTNRIFNNNYSENTWVKENESFDERFWDKIKSYNPSFVVFGHLHSVTIPIKQTIDNVDIYCVSADLIEFDPVEVVI